MYTQKSTACWDLEFTTHTQLLLTGEERRHAPLAVLPIRDLTGDVPEGPVQHPRRLQVRGVHQVVATLWMYADPLAV